MEQIKTLSELGAPLFESRSSQIFSWRDNTLIKLFREQVSPEEIDNEEVNTVETYEKGVSKVKCHGRIQVESRQGLVIERIPGKTLISLATSKPSVVFRCPQIMTELQLAMHNTPTSVIRDYKKMVKNALEREPLGFLTQEERAIIYEKLEALPEGESILHLDFHPDNIMSDGKSTSIIDWMTAARGAPAADIAATLYLLNEGEMIPGLSKAMAAALEMIRKAICKRYVKKYKAATGMTDAEIAPWRLPFLIVRLGVWNIESEVPVLREKIRAALKE